MLSKLSSHGKQLVGVAKSSGLMKKQGVRTIYQAPMREIEFLLDEVLHVEDHYPKLKKTGGEETNKEMIQMILEESAKFAENDLYPLSEVGDREGCKQLGPNEVKTPKGYKEAYDSFREGGWQGLSFPVEYGGQGLPQSLSLYQSELFATANWAWLMFPGLSKGGINTILKVGDEKVKAKYLEKLISGEWTSTMCLTEPHCGSDLAQVNTRAEPIGNGKYKISGTKIFISCGEHDFTENIVHCVLARLPDAPPGIKGISLFAVPKFKVNDDGTLTDEKNGVVVGRLEDKMGVHGSPTCELIFENAEGELLGEKNKGMRNMFVFINTSRMGTAIQGLAAAEGSYQNALAYAKDRVSMRALSGTKNPQGVADPIIVHPAVRSLLLTQKCIAEAGRAMVYDCALIADLQAEAEANGDEKTAAKCDDILGFRTPILKGALTELGLEAANKGIQVYGGHGFIKSNLQEQIVRDVRIGSIWEGTTQIQALDLLGRKVMLQKLKPLNHHVAEIRKLAWQNVTSPASTSNGRLRSHGWTMLKEAVRWQGLTAYIAMRASKDKEAIGLASEPYLMYAGYVEMGRQWLKMEAAAAKALDKDPSGPDADFYKGKILASHFYFENIFPRINEMIPRMIAPMDSVMDITPEQFAKSD